MSKSKLTLAERQARNLVAQEAYRLEAIERRRLKAIASDEAKRQADLDALAEDLKLLNAMSPEKRKEVLASREKRQERARESRMLITGLLVAASASAYRDLDQQAALKHLATYGKL